MNTTGGPAYPTSNYGAIVPISTGYSEGMTLRDYFAAKAMNALIASPRGTPDGRDGTDHYYAKCAYLMADAMLKARQA
jgi:hypothetical protein